jgi:hypothetical protein
MSLKLEKKLNKLKTISIKTTTKTRNKFFLFLNAKNNNKIVIFYAHKPVPTFQNNYETEYQTLFEICNYVKSNNMK